MSQPCTVLIAAPDRLPALKRRAANVPGEIVAFTDADALGALDLITRRRPAVVALERLFAASPRGAALIDRIKADPALGESEIRVIAHDGDDTHASPWPPAGPGAAPVDAVRSTAPATPLDLRGTRRAPRFPIADGTDVLVDGNLASLVDLSRVGAQVVSAAVLKPNQRVRMTLTDDHGVIRFSATVCWASFEIPAGAGPRYRAGIGFRDADPDAIEAYCLRHKA